MVDRAPAGRPQAARHRRRQDRLRGRARRGAAEPGATTTPSTSSRPAGSRCASCTIRRPRRSISPASPRATPTRSRSRAPATGSAAPPRRRNRPQEARARYEAAARYTTAYYGQLARARLGLGEIAFAAPPPLSAGAAPGAVDARGRARRANFSTRSTSATWSRRSWPTSPTRAPTSRALAVLAEIAEQERRRPLGAADRQARARPRLRVRPVRLPDRRAAALHADRARGRAGGGLFDRPPGERVQSARPSRARTRSGLMQVTPDAGRYIAKKFDVVVRPEPPAARQRLQRADGRGRARATTSSAIAAPTSWPSPATTPGPAG